MKEKLKTLLRIFICFFKIGAFTLGGGYAMIPLIQKETAEKRKWVSDEDILEIIAIAESTPGPIAINASTFIGYRVAGFFGAFFGTLGMILPSFVIILTISFVLRQLQEFTVVKYAFFGIRAGVLALILKALWSMYRQTKKNVLSYIIMAAAFICVAILNINTIFVLIGCAIFGLVWSLIAERRAKNDLS
ncbi:MAG: chromate transporter [Clostridia bacterium]|nr:chromate transporter [Clostridia bacterium]